MSTYTNISFNVSNDNPVLLDVAATAGTYNAVVSINGQEYVRTVTIDALGIEIENVFQANTTHTLKVYDTDGETLLDDTIYTISTPPVASSKVSKVTTIDLTTTEGQASIINSVFIGASKILVFVERDFEAGWTKSGPESDTIEFTNRFDGEYAVSITVYK